MSVSKFSNFLFFFFFLFTDVMASKGLSEDQIYQTLFPSESSGDEEEAPNPKYDDCDAKEGMEVGDGATGRLLSPSPSPSAASPPLLALPSPHAASPTPLSLYYPATFKTSSFEGKEIYVL